MSISYALTESADASEIEPSRMRSHTRDLSSNVFATNIHGNQFAKFKSELVECIKNWDCAYNTTQCINLRDDLVLTKTRGKVESAEGDVPKCYLVENEIALWGNRKRDDAIARQLMNSRNLHIKIIRGFAN